LRLPNLNCDSIYRVLKAKGLNRRPSKPTVQTRKGQGHFDDYDLGFVHLEVYEAENATNAVAFLKTAGKAFPFRITHELTDRDSCFTPDDFERACAKIKVSHRTTRPDTPKANGMVERFNGGVANEVLDINVASHADLEILLTGFKRACNRRRQRVLQGGSPRQKGDERIQLKPDLAEDPLVIDIPA